MSEVAWLVDQEQFVWRSLLAFHSKLIAKLDAEMLEKHGLNMDEYEVLVVLSEARGEQLRMSQIADAAIISRNGATRRIDHMASAGLVEKSICLEDRRGISVSLTPLGWERIKEAAPTHLSSVRRYIFDNIAVEDLDRMGRQLGAFICALDSSESVPAPVESTDQS